MTVLRGHPNNQQDSSVPYTNITAQPVDAERTALDVVSNFGAYEVATDAIDSFTATGTITAAAHVALRGDIIRFTNGALSGREFRVYATSTNVIYVTQPLTPAPANGNTFQILRYVTPLLGSDGSLQTSGGGGGGTVDQGASGDPLDAWGVYLTDDENHYLSFSHLNGNQDGINIGNLPVYKFNRSGTIGSGGSVTMSASISDDRPDPADIIRWDPGTNAEGKWAVVESVNSATTFTLGAPTARSDVPGETYKIYKPSFVQVDADDNLLTAGSGGGGSSDVNLHDADGNDIASSVTHRDGATRSLNVTGPTSYWAWSNDTTETGSTATILNATAHDARAGDIVQFNDTADAYDEWSVVLSVTANTITVQNPFSVAPSDGDLFVIFRPQFQRAGGLGVDSNGLTNITPVFSQVPGEKWDVDVASSALPSGAATELTLSAAAIAVVGLNNIVTAESFGFVNGDPGMPGLVAVRRDTASAGSAADNDYTFLGTDPSGRLWVNNSGVTQPVSAASLPLPAGASTSALQTTGNTSLGNIDTKTPALGQALAAASTPVVLTAAQVTTLTPPAAITNYATETGGNLATIAGKDFATQATLALIKARTDNIPAQGQALAAASLPVVLTALQVTALTPPTTVGLNAGSQIVGKFGIDQTTPGTTNLVALTAETTKVIGVTRSADGAGNLLTSNSTTYTAKFALDGNLLGTLGTAFSTAGKVDVKAADGDVFVRQATGTNLHTVVDSVTGTVTTKDTRSATGTQTSVASSASNVTLLASNANRLGASFSNDSTQICYVRCAATATSSNFSVKMFPNDYWEVPFNYTGIIDGIWASANGSMRVTEYA